MRYRLVSILSVGALLIVAGASFAAAPRKGATYRGTWGAAIEHNSISFKVSGNGKNVSHFVVSGLPLGCQGGGFGNPVSTSGSISNAATFKVTMRLVFAPAHRTTGTLTVSGKFLPLGKETGKLSTHFNSPFPTSCDRTDSYHAKVSP